MRKIKIVTDTTVDLRPEYYTEHHIEVLPLYINIAGKTYADSIEITPDKLFKIINETGERPSTTCQNEFNFEAKFRELLSQDYDIFYIGLGSGFSATYANACKAQEEIGEEAKGRIRCVDSANLSSGTGLLLMKAVKMIESGKTLDETADEITSLVPYVRSQFSINTLEYLHKGGRCSGTTRLFGTLLHIHPIIKVVDGKMVVAQKPMGHYKRALDTQIKNVLADKDVIDPDTITITHCMAEQDVPYIKSILEPIFPHTHFVETQASCTVSTHCGPRTIGILYVLKK